ncbi:MULTISPECIES: septation ring formation regulator EzrA [Sutcliffiella]|uniref:Septation ring formation regulator EzrA n=1 Tax=Sutcliffiella cohnii TaxID=33932 RepID=A0A223KU61_9BACI|nr:MULTISPECIES: septation ring formation regulator EzrA [Sutcliffiella]AST92863.1 septation ring formation regulator EzrA [Sutcliffiella cohnii]WBL14121.1 septation ring formation regulator EzrA [Sutcliffiella sp. NC1]
MEIIIGILTIAIIFVTFSYFSRKKIYKEIDRLEEWKMDITNKPVTEELSRVKHLNMTGQTEELFENWRNKWDDILTRQLPDIEELLFDTEECTDKYKFKRANQTLHFIDEKLEEIEEQIKQIYSELQELIGSQTKSVEKFAIMDEKYKEFKKQLLTQRHQYGLSIQTLEKELESLVEKFQAYEEATENGNYLEARDIVARLEEDFTEIQYKIEEIPNLLIDCQSVIPSQLAEIQSGSEEMLGEGYVLDHLELDKGVSGLEEKVKELLTLLKEAKVKEVTEVITGVKEELEGLYDKMEQEVLAKHFIMKEMEPTKEELDILMNEAAATKEETEVVQESYQLQDEDIATQKSLDKSIQTLYDRYVTLTNQLDEQSLAYTILKEELEDILEQIISLKELSSQHTTKLQALRKDELIARDQLYQLRKLLLNAKRSIEKSNIPGLPQQYVEQLTTSHLQLKAVSEQLEAKPLNMVAVNLVLREAVEMIESCSVSINELLEQAALSEKLIQYGNRYRSKNLEVHTKLLDAEQHFRNYEYANALEIAGTTLEKVEPGILRSLDAVEPESKNE